ncbi:MAG: magnesium transporter [Alphaproteobacteria bacterium]|nr:magnesium transporter [Alphaproteobacteria bacterium]
MANAEAPSEMAPDEGRGAERFYGLTQEFIEGAIAAIRTGDAERIRTLAAGVHAADLADLITLVTADERRTLAAALREDFDPETLAYLDEGPREDVVEVLGQGILTTAARELDVDDAVEIVGGLDPAEQRQVLDTVPAPERVALEQALSYPPDSAGRLMRRDLVAVPEFWTVGQTIDYLRDTADLPDEFREIFVVDPSHHPIGTVPLDRILRSKRVVVVRDIMDRDPKLVPARLDQEEVAFLFRQYDLVEAPVVDEKNRLVGVITVDDVVDVMSEEAEEDLMRLGGVSVTSLSDSIGRTTRSRLPWLFVNLGTALIASNVIGLFEATITEMVALAVLMPIVASMGGNAGTQTLTITVRALAMREITSTNTLRLINKQIAVSFLTGGAIATVIGAIAATWFGQVGLGAILAAAMVINILVAGLFGILVPLALHRLRIDPALGASIFVTMITDVVGFFAFLGLAAWVLL